MSKNDNSTQSFGLSDIFHFLGVAACAVLTFFSTIYVFYGNIIIAGFCAVIAFIVPYLIVDNMKRLKQDKELNKSDNTTPEMMLGGIYFVVVFLVLFVFHFHFIEVELSKKDEIKTAGLNKLKELKELKTAYEQSVAQKVNDFNTLFTTNFNNIKTADRTSRASFIEKLQTELGKGIDPIKLMDMPNDPSTAQDLEDARSRKEKTILQSYEQEALHKEYEEYTQNAQSVFDNWQNMKVVYYYNDIQNMYQTLLQAYKQKMPEFAYKETLTTNSAINLTSPISSLGNASAGGWLIALVVLLVMHFCILGKYLFAERPDVGPKLVSKRNNGSRPRGSIEIR